MVKVIEAKDVNLDVLIHELIESEMGFVLLSAKNSSFLDLLAERTTYEDRLRMYGNNDGVTYHLFPLMYGRKGENTADLIRSRKNAVHNLFCRWDALGYNKRRAKNSYRSKAFNDFLKKTGYFEADYMLFIAE